MKRNKREVRWLELLLALYLLTGLSYIWATPVLEKPDEEDHYGYLRYVREQRRLPPLAPHEAWLFQSKQPPLYYVLAALATAPLDDIADPNTLIVQNPYMDRSVPGYREDNRNVYLHPPAMTGVIFGGRFVSLLFGLGTVVSAYILARFVLPGHFWFAWATAAVVGFQPLFLFITTSLSNDAPVVFFATVAATLLYARHRHTDSRHFAVAMGVILGLSALTKVSALVFFPLVGVNLLLIHRRLDRALFKELAVIGVTALAVGGWWYARNALVYHDPFTLRAHLSPTTQVRPLVDNLWQDLRDIERTFWANLARVFISLTWLDKVALWWGRISAGVALIAAWRYRRCLVRRSIDVMLLGVWPLTFGLLLLGFWARQANWAWGRFLLPGLGPLMLLLLLGWYALLPYRWRKWGILGVAGGIVVTGILAPWLTIYPLYHPYRAPTTIEYPAELVLRDGAGRPIVTFLGYSLPQPYATPGSYVPVELCWETLGLTETPLTQFTQWLDLTPTRVGQQPQVVGGRHTYPGLGNLPTNRWPLGKRFCDRVFTPIAETATTPMAAALEIGFVDTQTGERLQYVTPDSSPVGWQVFKGIAIVTEEAMPVPGSHTPQYIFDNRIQLMDLAYSRTPAGLAITTTWTVADNPAYDAVMFVHAQDARGDLIAQVDRQPWEGRYPTSYWHPGVVITDTFTLELPAVTPLTLALGLYTLPEVSRLSLVDANGIPIPDDALCFGVE